jgi:23S rRNA maturation mini-RNase III
MKFKLLLCLIFLLPAFVAAQSPNKILGQANKALGGEKALKTIRSWQMSGTVTRQSDGASGAYRAFASTPNFYGETFDLNGFEIASGYNGKSGWTRDSRSGLRTLTGEASRDFQAETFYRSQRWVDAKTEKTKISAGGKGNVNGKAANVVILTSAKGVQIKLFFDAATNLLLREEIPSGGTVKTFDYADYRKVGNILEAFSIVSKIGDETYEIRLDEIKHNAPIAKASFDFPNVSNEPLPDIKTLLDEVRANADRIDAILEDYSYRETRIDREIDKSGNLVEKQSETVLLTFYKGFRIRRLIEKNGKPLSVSEQAKEDKDVEKQVAEIEERIAKREKREAQTNKSAKTPEEENRRISLSEALKGSLLVNPRRERFRGRDVVVFDYEPNPAFKPQTRLEKLFAFCTGAVWVDAQSKQVVRLEAFLTQSAGNFIGKVKRGASFSLENELVNNEIWLPSRADINLSVKILFAGININNLIKYGDYSKSKVEVKDATVDNPQ